MGNNFIIILFSFLSFVLLALVTIYLYLNRSSENLYSTLLKLIIPLLGTILILAGDIIKESRFEQTDFKIFYLFNKIENRVFQYNSLKKVRNGSSEVNLYTILDEIQQHSLNSNSNFGMKV